MCQIIRRSGKHTTRSAKDDFKKIVNELEAENVFSVQDGRMYHHFSGMPDSLLSNLDVTAMSHRINGHKRNIIMMQNAR